MLLTVLTPTYNRAYCLPTLYKSLKKQTFKDFTWLIVDDGSVDDTEDLVKCFKNEEYLNIVYCKKENGGKHSATNYGLAYCQTELIFFVDSDDWLPSDAIEKITDKWTNKCSSNEICGIIALKGKDENNPMEGSFLPTIETDTLFAAYKKHGQKADCAMILKTSVLMENLFPVIKNEIFVPEQYIWNKIDRKYKMLYMPEIVYCCEYLPDGYTKNLIKNIIKNPNGFTITYASNIEMAREMLEGLPRIIDIVKNTILYVATAKLIRGYRIIKNSPAKVWTILLYPLGLITYRLRYNNTKR